MKVSKSIGSTNCGLFCKTNDQINLHHLERSISVLATLQTAISKSSKWHFKFLGHLCCILISQNMFYVYISCSRAEMTYYLFIYLEIHTIVRCIHKFCNISSKDRKHPSAMHIETHNKFTIRSSHNQQNKNRPLKHFCS